MAPAVHRRRRAFLLCGAGIAALLSVAGCKREQPEPQRPAPPAASEQVPERGDTIVSGSIGETTAVELMKAGAHDYLMKDNLTRLAPVLARA